MSEKRTTKKAVTNDVHQQCQRSHAFKFKTRFIVKNFKCGFTLTRKHHVNKSKANEDSKKT